MSRPFEDSAGKVRFQADEDFSGKIIAGLLRREPRVAIQTAEQAGLRGVGDDTLLAFAAREGRILITHDRRTMPLHFARFIEANASPGVIIISQGIDILSAIEALLLIWEASTPDEWTNSLTNLPL